MRLTIDEFDYRWFDAIGMQKKGCGGNRGNHARYKEIVTAFDIETTYIPSIKQSVMYIWQWQFGGDVTVIGRTWDELRIFISRLQEHMVRNQYIVTYVHNLSYEFQFLASLFNLTNIFALKKRKVLKATMEGFIELRCSYLLTNMSLKLFTHKWDVPHKKLPDYEYDKMRFSFTPMTDKELDYCCNDVQGLVEAVEAEMRFNKDNLYTIPLTSTGYVRRDIKETMRSVSKQFIAKQLPDMDTYLMLREAFRGGNTHANRYYAGEILENVYSADRSSSYPDTLCNEQYPISKFIHKGAMPMEQVIRLITNRKKAVVGRFAMVNIRLREGQYCPYLSKSLCRGISKGTYDNGRVLTADYLETTLTDIDLKILLNQYDFDEIHAVDIMHANYGYLPKPLVRQICHYYEGKTSLKGVEGKEDYYTKFKNLVNAIYGLMAQDPVKQDILFDLNDGFTLGNAPLQELLDAANKRAFVPYQWGVWTTAWARWHLEEAIQMAGEDFVYCDTDSVKSLTEIDFTAYNAERIANSTRSGAYAVDANGETHYMGVYEPEVMYAQFVTLGAKKYCYTYEAGGKTHATISGVRKKTDPDNPERMGGGDELDMYDGIHSFKPGFVFVKAGGAESIYNDHPEITTYRHEGRKIHISRNLAIRPSTYTLGITDEYRKLISFGRIK